MLFSLIRAMRWYGHLLASIWVNCPASQNYHLFANLKNNSLTPNLYSLSLNPNHQTHSFYYLYHTSSLHNSKPSPFFFIHKNTITINNTIKLTQNPLQPPSFHHPTTTITPTLTQSLLHYHYHSYAHTNSPPHHKPSLKHTQINRHNSKISFQTRLVETWCGCQNINNHHNNRLHQHHQFSRAKPNPT